MQVSCNNWTQNLKGQLQQARHPRNSEGDTSHKGDLHTKFGTEDIISQNASKLPWLNLKP